MSSITFESVSKSYGDVLAVDSLDLDVADGELLVLLGPSGCGKTTALRMVAGLEEISSGTLRLGGEVVNEVDPKDRDVAMVFQSYALYPHLTVARNIEFPLRQRGIDKDERRRQVAAVAATLGLDTLLDRKPGQLSGGQRQRVALGRAIVRSPQAFLMDEPLSNLDAALRVQTRADIVALQKRLGTTTLYVTHDQVEAMTMGHRIAVLSGGVLQQVAPPQELYAAPANVFVAGFLGSPPMNLLAGTLQPDPRGALVVQVLGGTVELSEALSQAVGRTVPPGPDAAVTVGLRPESLTLDPSGSLAATVDLVELLGAEAHVICSTPDGSRLVIRMDARQPLPDIGAAVRIGVAPGSAQVFEQPSGRRVAVPS